MQEVYNIITSDILAKNAPPQSNHEKNIRQLKLRDIYKNTYPVIFKSVKVTEDKESPNNSPRLKENKEKWWLNAMWYPGPDPQRGKRP